MRREVGGSEGAVWFEGIFKLTGVDCKHKQLGKKEEYGSHVAELRWKCFEISSDVKQCRDAFFFFTNREADATNWIKSVGRCEW